MSNLTIVMYHYVRPIRESEFPGIKGLELEGFNRQLDFLEQSYSIVTTEQVIAAVTKDKKLPKHACWLTFDDGYKDHYMYVLPELIKRNLSGAFFPPRAVIEQDKLLDVNAIHYILSKTSNRKLLVSDLYEHCLNNGISQVQLNSYYKDFGVPNRWDDADTIFIKRMLQHVLPENTRNLITTSLFKKYVGRSPQEFSSKLYMNIQEVSTLVKKGMYIGSHGSMHYWLDRCSEEKQKEDIVESLSFLESVGMPTKDWIMCYPYGAYNNHTLSLLKELGASIGITTKVKIADLSTDNPFTLPRLDTNDFPQ